MLAKCTTSWSTSSSGDAGSPRRARYGAREHHAGHVADASRDDRGGRKLSDTHADVDALVEQIDDAIVEREVDPNARKGVEKTERDGRDVAGAEHTRGADAQQTGGGGVLRGFVQRRRARRGVDALVPARRTRRRWEWRVVSCDRAAGAHAFFERGEGTRHRRRRAPELTRGLGEAASVDDGEPGLELVDAIHRFSSRRCYATGAA
ncbi:MAG: hypothetical protein R3B99_28475 [Polyangiales bacterium]